MRTIGLVLAVVMLVGAAQTAWAEDWAAPAWVSVDDGAPLVRSSSAADTRSGPCCCLRDQRCGWSFSLGALYMGRIDSSDSPILLDSANNNAEVLNGDDYDLGFAPGFELGITKHRLFGCVDLEFKTTWFAEWSDDRDFAFLDDPILTTNPPWGTSSVGPVATEYESQYGSLELNARWRSSCLQRVRWLAGVRCIALEEEMNLAFNDPQTPNRYDVDADNLLCGVQVGAEIDLINNKCFCLDLTVKAGAYLNQANHEATYRLVDVTLWHVDEDDSQFAYSVEAGLGATWCISSCIALRAEYRVMWIDGLALAPEQTSATEPAPLSGSGIDTNGSILMHGVYLGAEIRL